VLGLTRQVDAIIDAAGLWGDANGRARVEALTELALLPGVAFIVAFPAVLESFLEVNALLAATLLTFLTLLSFSFAFALTADRLD
jgi:hypothetical protein